MGRKYAPLYNDFAGGSWSIIAQDPTDENWFVHIPDAGSKQAAIEVANALNNSSE